MSGIVVKAFEEADEVVTFDLGRLDVVKISSLALGWEVLQPGWRWSTHVKPIVGTEWCEFHHVSIVLDGRVGFETRDGDRVEAGAGTVLDVAPGHASWVGRDAPAILQHGHGALGLPDAAAGRIRV